MLQSVININFFYFVILMKQDIKKKGKEKFINQITNIEFLEKTVPELIKKYKILSIVILSILFFFFVLPILWSWFLPFYCNNNIAYSFIELLLVIFVYGLIFPFIGNIWFIAYKLSNCESNRP